MNQNIWGFPNNSSSTFEETLGYKTYVSMLQQSGVTAPTVTVLQNTLGVNISWAYLAPGIYMGTLDQNIFLSPNEYVTVSGSWSDGTAIANIIQAEVIFSNLILLASISDATPADDLIGNPLNGGPSCALEIRKYS